MDRDWGVLKILILSLLHCRAGSINVTLTERTESVTVTPKYPCLREQFQMDTKLQCQDDTLKLLNKQLPQMLHFTASRGNAFDNLKLSLRDINLNMRQNYQKMIENTGKNTFPLLVATDSEPGFEGVGGVWKLYLKDGTMKRIMPVSAEFEFYKCLSHLVLGVFSIVSPYFRNPRSINWQPALRVFQERLNEIRFLLEMNESRIPPEDCNRALKMCNRVNDYIEKVMREKEVTHTDFFKFGKSMAPLIEESMIRAAKAHAEGTIPGLNKLKEELGEEEWRKVFVIIPTTWPVSLYNIRLQALEKVMSIEQIKAQVLFVEGALSEEAAKTTLGRVIADRVVAQSVWGQSEDPNYKDHLFSLSTRRDLLSSIAARALNEECMKPPENPSGKPRCPFAGRFREMMR